MLAAWCATPTPTCLQVLLLSFFEQGLVSLTATAVKLITTTPASEGYLMSRGMVSLHHTTTSAFVPRHTMCPATGGAQALPAAQLPGQQLSAWQLSARARLRVQGCCWCS